MQQSAGAGERKWRRIRAVVRSFTRVPAGVYCAMYSGADELITADTKSSGGAVWGHMIEVNILVGATVNRR